eukprot:TRINITY_DN10190_c0_g1_i1.p1 TRINITY_DN10190_c0_g1~~TRINITY_DN10190_c0_g1_i1.p1  ORF type:complete len:720 (-),score=147.46 TRINITY_DN10190_c0_g1_i1:306-2465(-)
MASVGMPMIEARQPVAAGFLTQQAATCLVPVQVRTPSGRTAVLYAHAAHGGDNGVATPMYDAGNTSFAEAVPLEATQAVEDAASPLPEEVDDADDTFAEQLVVPLQGAPTEEEVVDAEEGGGGQPSIGASSEDAAAAAEQGDDCVSAQDALPTTGADLEDADGGIGADAAPGQEEIPQRVYHPFRLGDIVYSCGHLASVMCVDTSTAVPTYMVRYAANGAEGLCDETHLVSAFDAALDDSHLTAAAAGHEQYPAATHGDNAEDASCLTRPQQPVPPYQGFAVDDVYPARNHALEALAEALDRAEVDMLMGRHGSGAELLPHSSDYPPLLSRYAADGPELGTNFALRAAAEALGEKGSLELNELHGGIDLALDAAMQSPPHSMQHHHAAAPVAAPFSPYVLSDLSCAYLPPVAATSAWRPQQDVWHSNSPATASQHHQAPVEASATAAEEAWRRLAHGPQVDQRQEQKPAAAAGSRGDQAVHILVDTTTAAPAGGPPEELRSRPSARDTSQLQHPSHHQQQQQRQHPPQHEQQHEHQLQKHRHLQHLHGKNVITATAEEADRREEAGRCRRPPELTMAAGQRPLVHTLTDDDEEERLAHLEMADDEAVSSALMWRQEGARCCKRWASHCLPAQLQSNRPSCLLPAGRHQRCDGTAVARAAHLARQAPHLHQSAVRHPAKHCQQATTTMAAASHTLRPPCRHCIRLQEATRHLMLSALVRA